MIRIVFGRTAYLFQTNTARILALLHFRCQVISIGKAHSHRTACCFLRVRPPPSSLLFFRANRGRGGGEKSERKRPYPLCTQRMTCRMGDALPKRHYRRNTTAVVLMPHTMRGELHRSRPGGDGVGHHKSVAVSCRLVIVATVCGVNAQHQTQNRWIESSRTFVRLFGVVRVVVFVDAWRFL